MNIKRMADEYRDQITKTGESLLINEINLHLRSTWYHKVSVGQTRTNIRRWHNHLKRALGSEKDLRELQKVWDGLVKLSALCGKNMTDLDPKRELIFEEIRKQMKKFLEKLPRLIEKSLTRSVRESGIRLR